jgi:ABC-type branched-subunit amino acid transport system substrate-binding protein
MPIDARGQKQSSGRAIQRPSNPAAEHSNGNVIGSLSYGRRAVALGKRGGGDSPLPKRTLLLGPLLCLVVLVSAACGSSSSAPSSAASGSAPGGGSAKTFTVGVLTDLTGLASQESGSSIPGIKAGVGVAGTEGYKIKYVVADTGSSPSGALTAAQKLVEQDHVFAVLALSSLTFSASTYLTSKQVPVVGAAFDGPEWLLPESFNMFSVLGNLDFTKVTTTAGLFLKSVGVTNLGSLGYSVSPSSAAAARAAAASAEEQGIKAGYLNDSFPFGSTNVAPVALGMQHAGVDGVDLSVLSTTAFSLINTLKEQGVHLKAALLPTGYGGDLFNSGKGAIRAAQGDYFFSNFEPIEMHTAATEKLQNALARYAGIHIDPTFAQTISYLSVLGLVQGLQGAGASPTQHSLITSLAHITNYQAEGLWGGHQTVDWSKRPMGSKQCYWVTQLKGSTFHVVNGSAPVCGSIIPGKSV